MFILFMNDCSKTYDTLDKAKAVYLRALRYKATMQAKYDGVQVLNYLAVDEVYINDDGMTYPVEYDVMSFDGGVLKNKAVRDRLIANLGCKL